MTDIDRGLELVRRANPHATTLVEDKPTADEMLRAIQEGPVHIALPVTRTRRPGPVLAAAAFALVLVVLLPILLLGDNEPVASVPPTLAPPTTLSGNVEGAIVGAWANGWGIWEFDDAGTYSVITIGVIRDTGTYEVNGDQVTLSSAFTSRDCSGASGVYTVAVEQDGSLGFTSSAIDGCASRANAIAGASLKPVQSPTEAIDPVVDPETQGLVDRFVDLYNAGDVDALASFLHPDFERPITRERVAEPQPLETVLTLYRVDAALNMAVAVECTASPTAILCEPTKYDDLHRVLGIEASKDREWSFTFQDGLVRTWGEHRENVASEYEAGAIVPFLDWMRENHPERDLFPFVDVDWLVGEDIADEVAGFVAEWAASSGVELDTREGS